jgi:hypothetical protein
LRPRPIPAVAGCFAQRLVHLQEDEQRAEDHDRGDERGQEAADRAGAAARLVAADETADEEDEHPDHGQRVHRLHNETLHVILPRSFHDPRQIGAESRPFNHK